MASSSRCATCGFTNFTPRLNVDTVSMNDRLRSDYGVAGVIEQLFLLDKDYQDYSSEIARLQLQIRLLSSRQRQLKEYELKLRSLTSPIRKLPNEVLVSIFDHLCKDNRMQERPDLNHDRFKWPNGEDGSTDMPALVISSVCSRW